MKPRESSFFEINLTKDALTKKIGLFADKKGYINQASIYKTCRDKFHFTEDESKQFAKDTMRSAWTYGTPGVERIIFQGICGQFKPHSGIPFFTLTYDGGLYHLDGSFNEKAFAILEKRYACEDWDGEKIISRALMKRFLEKETYQATRASHAPWLYQKRGMQNHEETFNLFFDKLISRYKINSFTQNKEGYVTLRNLKLWYVSGQTILNDIESGRLPAKQSF